MAAVESPAPSLPFADARTRWVTAVVITVVATAAAMALGMRIWPSPAGAPTPPASLLPYFIGLELAGSILFGLGLTFLVLGYGLVARAGQPLVLTYATYLSIAWLLVSWWPHGNLHRSAVAGDWNRLLTIDLGFHLTLMAAAVIVAAFFIRVLLRLERS